VLGLRWNRRRQTSAAAGIQLQETQLPKAHGVETIRLFRSFPARAGAVRGDRASAT
jgi:hypothetical protein